jgi:8-oxo-dGTP pyrophosphatase MutT (NUDIX family)
MKSIRQEISETLKQISPFDLKEKEHIEDALRWIASGAEIFKIKSPDVPPKHFVSYSLLFDPKQEKMLLLDHRKALLMLPSGGHLNRGELPADAAKRELMEEVGVEPQWLSKDLGVPVFLSQTETVGITAGHTDVSLWYVFKGDSSAKIDDQNEEFKREFSGYSWLSLDAILSTPIEKFDANMHRFVEKLKNGIMKHKYKNKK